MFSDTSKSFSKSVGDFPLPLVGVLSSSDFFRQWSSKSYNDLNFIAYEREKQPKNLPDKCMEKKQQNKVSPNSIHW